MFYQQLAFNFVQITKVSSVEGKRWLEDKVVAGVLVKLNLLFRIQVFLM
jgi:hypothetical protein